MTAADTLLDRLGRWMARRLTRPASGFVPYTHGDFAALEAALRPGDVILVEGDGRISAAIKYLTQSTWSHAALYVGRALDPNGPAMLVEVNLGEGCVEAPLAKYECANLRICRAANLTDAERASVVRYMTDRIGTRYDLHNIVDLARYFLPEPPVPRRWRRRMLALGAGDPTRAICSSMIAQAFQSARYPILPTITRELRTDRRSHAMRQEILHIRHHSLFAPRDFDLSPYFGVVKPALTRGFNHRRLVWADDPPDRTGAEAESPGHDVVNGQAASAGNAPALIAN